MVRGLPTKVAVHSSEIIEATREVTDMIIDTISNVVQNTPAELVSDIAENGGIVLTGGGSKIFGMAKLIEERVGVKAYVVENPELAVATGAGTAKMYVKEPVNSR